LAVERQRDFTEALMANTREHRYAVSLTWNGNLGTGTSGYRDYSRNYEIVSESKPAIQGSADPAFRGDRSRWNPNEQEDRADRDAKRRTSVRRRLVWEFFCQVVFCLLPFLVWSGKTVPRPVACDQVRGARGRCQGTEMLAQLSGLPLSVACVSQRPLFKPGAGFDA
jgi:hypothetical protein